MIILGIQTQRRDVIRGLSRRHSGIVKETLQEVAEFWHERLFPAHFGASNRSTYNLERRNPVYTNFIKRKEGTGVGKFRDEVLSGKSERQMKHLYKITGTSKVARVRMTAPTYFTRPYIGSFTDPRTGRTKRITRQPNKPDEVTRFSEGDKQTLRDVAAQIYAAKIQAASPPPTTTTT